MFSIDNDQDRDARCRRLVVAGRLDAGRFSAFARSRARMLALEFTLGDAGQAPDGSGHVAMIVRGDPQLLGMFEMACAVGPEDCIVDDMTSVPCESRRGL